MRTTLVAAFAAVLGLGSFCASAEEATLHTVASIQQDGKTLAGQQVRVQGKVVKVSNDIMGRNWLHVQDGTGDGKPSDLLVTSEQTANTGDQVTVTGRVTVDKDFGSGYKYAVLVEEANVVVDKAAAPAKEVKAPGAPQEAAAAEPAAASTDAGTVKTVASLYQDSKALAGKEVQVHGKVVKVSNGIMGRNWLHVQDGSGDGKSNDLLVTSDETARIGDEVTVSGLLAADKDFGAGYAYAVLVENAKVAITKAAPAGEEAKAAPAVAPGAPGDPNAKPMCHSAANAKLQTVAAIYQDSKALAGQQVRVQGKVVKANSGIMGRNWLHVQDGTGDEKTNDLLVTSDQSAAVGDQVEVVGCLSIDKDFGAGYAYAVLVEDASLTAKK